MNTETATKVNRIDSLFKSQNSGVLSVFLTAGFPNLNATVPLIQRLEKAGVDMIEIGMPFSDPLADGPTIQGSNEVALKNGMSLKVLFKQLAEIRKTVKIPLLLMGYINPVIQYGIPEFCAAAERVGVDGLILPDLPLYEYETEYKTLFQKHGLHNIFLVTPQTSNSRLKQLDEASKGFLYVVSSSSTTGKTESGFAQEQIDYFSRLQKMNLATPKVIGFGISDHAGFHSASTVHANGAIVGSAFIRAVEGGDISQEAINSFVNNLRGKLE